MESDGASRTYRMLRGNVSAGDDELVRQVAAGSQDALGQLYDRYVGQVFAAARRMTSDRQLAEEVVQETFLALWNRAELYDRSQGALGSWLHAIARNRAIDRLRAAARRPTLVGPSTHTDDEAIGDEWLDGLARAGDVPTAAAPPIEPQPAAEQEWARATVRQALEAMPDDERGVIVMAYDQDLSQSEIAERLGMPLGTVKTRTRRALRRLRDALGPVFDSGEVSVTAAPGTGGTDGSR